MPSDHPVLIDHFPGNPLVPGALILDHVMEGIRSCDLGDVVTLGLREIKFKSPLRGNEWAEVIYIQSPLGIRFSVMEGAREIAAGIIDSTFVGSN